MEVGFFENEKNPWTLRKRTVQILTEKDLLTQRMDHFNLYFI